MTKHVKSFRSIPDHVARERLAKLLLLSRRPRLLAAHVRHWIRSRRDLQLLRVCYARRIAGPAPGAGLRLPEVELPPASDLPGELRPRADQLRAEADAIVQHDLTLLGWGSARMGVEIDWNRDHLSGVTWPLEPYMDVRVLRSEEGGDPKFPWELSRCHHLLTLARAGRLFGEVSYVRELHSQLVSWLDANPPGLGINWVNPMEAGIRVVNWLWALATSEPLLPLDPSLRARIAESLVVHGRHIAANLEGGPAFRGNHYVADMLGLAAIGTWVDAPESVSWREQAFAALEYEIRRQVSRDGANLEASLPYHGFVLEMFLVGMVTAEASGRSVTAEYRSRMAAMAELSLAVRHPGGRSPVFGDQDSGRVLPGSSLRLPTHDHVIWLAAALLDQDRPLDATPSEELAWTLGVTAWSRLARRSVRRVPTRRVFPQGGVFALGSEVAHLVVRLGDVGQNGYGGHAHNDISSFELSLDGELLIVDPGTFTYTADLAQRDADRSARTHNVVTVDGREMRPIPHGQPFHLPEHGRPKLNQLDAGNGVWLLRCSHDGFRRRRDQVACRRTFALRESPASINVTDEVTGNSRRERSLESRIHLAPDVAASVAGAADVELRSNGRRFLVSFFGAERIALEPAWTSPAYGARVESAMIVAHSSARLPTTIGFRIVLNGRRNDAAADFTSHTARSLAERT
jgi:hypothetical protein